MMKIPCSAASLPALCWALPGQCTVRARCRTRHTGLGGTGCVLLTEDRNTAWWECSRNSLGESRLPFLLSSRGSHRLIPIDHVWRVGKKNNLPHGSSNSSEPGFQRLWHEQNGKQDHSLLSGFPKPPSAVVRPCPDCPTTCGWAPTSLLHKTRHVQVNVRNAGLPTVVSPNTDVSRFRRSPWTKHRRCQSNACFERQQKSCSCDVLHGGVRSHCC